MKTITKSIINSLTVENAEPYIAVLEGKSDEDFKFQNSEDIFLLTETLESLFPERFDRICASEELDV